MKILSAHVQMPLVASLIYLFNKIQNILENILPYRLILNIDSQIKRLPRQLQKGKLQNVN